MEEVNILYSNNLRMKVSGNGIEDPTEVLIVKDRLEKSYQNRGRFEKLSDCGGNIGRSRSKSRARKNIKCYYSKNLGAFRKRLL